MLFKYTHTHTKITCVYHKNINSSFSCTHILNALGLTFRPRWKRRSGPEILRGDPFFLGPYGPFARRRIPKRARRGPPALPDSCVGCTSDRAAPKQSPLHSEHISCRRDSAIKLMVDGGGLAMYPTTIDNLRNPSPRFVTDIIIHSILNACWCSVRLEMFKRNKVSKLHAMIFSKLHAMVFSRRCYRRSVLFSFFISLYRRYIFQNYT